MVTYPLLAARAVRRAALITRRPLASATWTRSTATYRGSHRQLLVDVTGSSAMAGQPLRLDCVCVPAGRRFTRDLRGLRLAVDLAVARDAYLLVVCSRRARTADFPPEFRKQLGGRLILLDYSRLNDSWKPELPSAELGVNRHRRTDSGEKRNFALSLAARLDWQSVLFLDDDVFPLDSGPTLDQPALARALAALAESPQLQVVGWSATDFPDNSVVGHARRRHGLGQEVFLGAGALLVRCDQALSFFPKVYNEDWLFLVGQATLSSDPARAIGWAGNIGQCSYPPFLRSRARSEEIGDVLGEGLMNLFEDYGNEFAGFSTVEYWRQCVIARRRLIRQLGGLIPPADRLGDRHAAETDEKVRLALSAATEVDRSLSGAELASYISIWRSDQALWQSHVQKQRGLTAEQKDPARVIADLIASSLSPLPCARAAVVIAPRRPIAERAEIVAMGEVFAQAGPPYPGGPGWGSPIRDLVLRFRRKRSDGSRRNVGSKAAAASELAPEPAGVPS